MSQDKNSPRDELSRGDLPFDPQDPRWSAYLFGELDEKDRAEVELRIEQHDELRKLVDELRGAAGALEAGLLAEPGTTLRTDQRKQIAAEAASGSIRLLPTLRTLAAAALLFFAAYGLDRIPDAPNPDSMAPDETLAEAPLERASREVPRSQSLGFGGGGGRRLANQGGPAGPATTGGLYRGPGNIVPPSPPTTSGPSSPGPASLATPGRMAYSFDPAAKPAPTAGKRQLDASNGVVAYRLRADRTLAAGELEPARTERTLRYLVEADPAAAYPAKELDLRPGGLTDEAFGDEFPWDAIYEAPPENPFVATHQDPMSTFSIDVDTASYTNVRRHLMEGRLPPPDAVRLEEFVNYFRYDDPAPIGDIPFSVTTEVASCPWQPRHQLIRVGLKGREIAWNQRPASNLVFLLDVSGSMGSGDKLPLLKRAMKLLVEQLDERDSVAIVVYAGASGLALPATPGNRHVDIMNALDQLQAGGSTNGGAGIQLAYKIAQEQFTAGGLNRVILATDGDFNVGVSSREELAGLIEEKREGGVFLSVLGFGSGGMNDAGMEQLADKGNGQYAYIDSIDEGRRVLVDQVGGTMMTIAKDVKIQVAFNPNAVRAWRLLGYENRLLEHQDFDDDRKDAGEIGAGVSVTALYEIVPSAQPMPDGLQARPVSDYAIPGAAAGMPYDELMLLRLRYKEPDGERSQLLETKVRTSQTPWHAASANVRFAAAAAGFAMLLRNSAHAGSLTLEDVHEMAYLARGEDAGGYRVEFLGLVEKAKAIATQAATKEK